MSPRPRARTAFVFLMSALLLSTACTPRNRQQLRGHVPVEVARLTPVGPLPETTHLDLVIGLPLRHADSLTALLTQLYDTASPRFADYLTPEQFTAAFGPTAESYAQLEQFAESNHLAVVRRTPSRKTLHVRATAGVVNRLFHITLQQYRHPTENRLFYAPDVEPSIDIATPILHISGLDDMHPPGRVSHRLYPGGRPPGDPRFAGGSGTLGDYTGNDFRAAYASGVSLTGSKQVVGILEMFGYEESDILAYESAYSIPPVPLQNVYVGGYTGATTHVESAADIELAISMAPGLAKVVVYGAYTGTGVHDILSEMATPTQGEPLPAQLSSSYYFFYDQNVYDALAQFRAQGEAFFVASGDYGSYDEITGAGAFPPADHPLVTSVGGTLLQTASAGGAWTSEIAAPFSGGGYSPWGATNPQFAIPPWQSDMDFTAAQGSATVRNAPDVAMVASNISVYEKGQWAGFSGTSASAPLWAGFMALVNENALRNGRPPIGFANPALYRVAKSADYPKAFHDITVGNNFNATNPTKYQTVPGFDLVTGWGSPIGAFLIDALTRPALCHTHPELCYGVFDPEWWLKCPACRIDMLIAPPEDFGDVAVYDAAGRQMGQVRRLSSPVSIGGVRYTHNVTLPLKRGWGFVLRAEPRAGHAAGRAFKPMVLVRLVKAGAATG